MSDMKPQKERPSHQGDNFPWLDTARLGVSCQHGVVGKCESCLSDPVIIAALAEADRLVREYTPGEVAR